jgi:ectoine hydroxylase-related dioxygenase (phytanoyl-CoA dioxygenase family)
MWVALDDATLQNGTFHVIPGSHDLLHPHRKDLVSNHLATCADYVDDAAAVAAVVPAGAAVFFCYGIVSRGR